MRGADWSSDTPDRFGKMLWEEFGGRGARCDGVDGYVIADEERSQRPHEPDKLDSVVG